MPSCPKCGGTKFTATKKTFTTIPEKEVTFIHCSKASCSATVGVLASGWYSTYGPVLSTIAKKLK